MKVVSDPVAFRTNIRNVIEKKINNSKWAENIERGVFNYCIKLADERRIVKKWENPYFVILYKDRFRSIYVNITEQNIKKITEKNETSRDCFYVSSRTCTG